MIFANVSGKFAKFARMIAGELVSDLLRVNAPAQKMPVILGVQVDSSLDPGASPATTQATIVQSVELFERIHRKTPERCIT